MAQIEHLPIYKAAYDLCLYFEQIVRNFSRYHKYSIGQDLRDGARRVLKLIVRANARGDKGSVLLQIREEVEELKVLLRLCHDAKGFPNFNSFEHAIGLVANVARQDAEAKLLDLQRELREHTYRPGRSVCFVTEGPKPREVFAADFRDRIVHHLVVSRTEPVFECRFIHDSYACRKGKGVLAASDRVTNFLRQVTANGRRPAWALKLDVASFFPSIHKQTLYEILARSVRDPELRWVTRTILFHDPTADYRFKSGPHGVPAPEAPDYPIPAQKSLFGKNNQRGLPIGNLTSQFWANVYLNELDQFVKRTLKCRYYVRYVDDLVVIHDDPGVLREWRREIEAFLGHHLGLRLREPGVEPTRVRGGIDFVGWKTFWNHRRPRRRTLANCEGRLQQFRRVLQPMWGGAALRLDVEREPASLPGLRATLASYSGHLRHGAAWRDWVALWRRHGWLEAVFVPEGRNPWRVQVRWPVGAIGGPRFAAQYGRLIRHVGDRALLFCQVGRFVEFYGPQREPAARILRLVRVRIARGGHAFSVGFPLRLSAEYVSRAVRAGYVVAEVREAGRVEPRCAVRRVVGLWWPVKSSSEARGDPGGKDWI